MQIIQVVPEKHLSGEHIEYGPYSFRIGNFYHLLFHSEEKIHERISCMQVESVAAEGKCIKPNGDKAHMTLSSCEFMTGNTVLIITKKNEIRSRFVCLDAKSVETPITFENCNEQGGSQRFTYIEKVNY